MVAGEWIQVGGVFVALLGVIAGIAKFMWNKVEVRFLKIENKLEECDRERRKSETRRGILWTVVMLMKHELRRVVPDSPILADADCLIASYHDAGDDDGTALERAIVKLSKRYDS